MHFIGTRPVGKNNWGISEIEKKNETVQAMPKCLQCNVLPEKRTTTISTRQQAAGSTSSNKKITI